MNRTVQGDTKVQGAVQGKVFHLEPLQTLANTGVTECGSRWFKVILIFFIF
jgi:hypothetical protein